MATHAELLNILESTASLFKKTPSNLKKCSKTRLTKNYVEGRIALIDNYWASYKMAHENLVKITSKEAMAEIDYFKEDIFEATEEVYLGMTTDLRDLLDSMVPTMQSAQKHTAQTAMSMTYAGDAVRLPRIELQKFSGNYEEWIAFRDLFKSVVHDNHNISDVQKFHYLKCSVTGEAQALIRLIQVTNQNYMKAWKILDDRYGNKRLILNSVLKRLFTQRKLTSQSSTYIKSLLDVTTDCLNNLDNMSIPTESWDPMVIYLVVQRLDADTHKEWEEYAYKEDSATLPRWSDLKMFLATKYRTLELVSSSQQREKPVKERSYHTTTAISDTTAPTTSSKKICKLCQDNHTLCHCKQFTTLQPNEKLEYVKKNNLCFNCLVPGHSSRLCKLQMSCRLCKRRHHTLLHRNQDTDSSASSGTNQPKASHSVEELEVQVNTTIASHYNTEQTTSVALLAIAMVTIRSEQNHTVVLRALVDQGSQASFITQRAAQMLNLNKQSARGSIIGVGSSRSNVDHVVQLQVGSRWDPSFKMDLNAYVMNKQLTTQLPSKAVTVNQWTHLEGLELADPSYHTPGPIDLLLGVKEYAQIVQQQLIKGPPGSPCAQSTYLGWILFGELNSTNLNVQSFLVLHHQVSSCLMKWLLKPA